MTEWQNRIVGEGEENPDQLLANPENWRVHPKLQQDVLSDVLDEVGWVQRVIVNRTTGHMVDGHLRAQLAISRGEPSIPVTYVELTVDEERKILATLDPLAAMAATDEEKRQELLAQVHAEGEALSAWIGGMIEPPSLRGDPDEVPELPTKPTTKVGDLWRLGDHRLVCGDSADAAVLDRLLDGVTVGCILTDPPYGIDLDTDYSKLGTGSTTSILHGTKPRTYRPMIGDDKPFDASALRQRFASVGEQFWFGGDYYRRTLSEDDRDGSWLVWDKRNDSSDAGFGSGFELVWSSVPHKRTLLRHYFFGAFGVEARNRVHPTQKPTPLLREILDRWGADGVLDPFLGSGSTLIAAEQKDWACYGTELDPAYCDVIVARWEGLTGKKAKRSRT